uniref:Uncharacterized protein n=1 Tax=Sphaerodactylus townsendi TaxID=933632 RepID=A0ACB8F915_9SAUR
MTVTQQCLLNLGVGVTLQLGRGSSGEWEWGFGAPFLFFVRWEDGTESSVQLMHFVCPEAAGAELLYSPPSGLCPTPLLAQGREPLPPPDPTLHLQQSGRQPQLLTWLHLPPLDLCLGQLLLPPLLLSLAPVHMGHF